MFWIWLKKQFNQAPKLVAVGKFSRNWVVIALKDSLFDFFLVTSRERFFTRAKLVQNAANSKHITLNVARKIFPHLRSDVVWCSAAGLDLVIRLYLLCETEVADLDLVALQEQV